MVLAKSKDGQIFKVENGKYYDLQSNKVVETVTPDQIIETIKVGFTLWQVIKQFWSLIQKLFKK